MWSYLIYLYTAGCLYMFIRGWQSLEIIKRRRVWFAVIFWIVALPFVVVRLRFVSGVAFYIVGYSCLAVVLYGFLILLVIDILRIIRWVAKIKPAFIYRNYLKAKALIFAVVSLALAAIIAGGYVNSNSPRATHLTVAIDKKAGQLTTLRVAMVSDIHLGNIYGRKSLARIVDVINEHYPDIVLLAGDIFDGNPESVIEKDMGAEFKRLQAKYGVYFVNGNHERGRTNAFDYLALHGIQPLLDTIVCIDSSFYVAGRIDRSTRVRKTIPELLGGIDHRLPVIMLDHQPLNLEEAEQAGIDMQLSGHTHHGQMFPLNYITARMYEQDWGFLQKNKTNYYISCGTGTWGHPIRTSGYSEVVIIELEFINGYSLK